MSEYEKIYGNHQCFNYDKMSHYGGLPDWVVKMSCLAALDRSAMMVGNIGEKLQVILGASHWDREICSLEKTLAKSSVHELERVLGSGEGSSDVHLELDLENEQDSMLEGFRNHIYRLRLVRTLTMECVLVTGVRVSEVAERAFAHAEMLWELSQLFVGISNQHEVRMQQLTVMFYAEIWNELDGMAVSYWANDDQRYLSRLDDFAEGLAVSEWYTEPFDDDVREIGDIVDF